MYPILFEGNLFVMFAESPVPAEHIVDAQQIYLKSICSMN